MKLIFLHMKKKILISNTSPEQNFIYIYCIRIYSTNVYINFGYN